MKVKPGYKQTEIGFIPNDWYAKKFTECSDIIHGFQFREEHFSKNGIIVAKIGTLIDGGGLNLQDVTFIPENKLKKFARYILNKGDVLMALTGATLGKVSIVDTNEIALQNYRVGKFVNKVNSTKEYIFYLLQSSYIQKTIKKLVNEAAQPNLGKGDFDKFIVPIPPTIKEQTAIAQALSDTDELITSLDKLIAKKRSIKQGAMQQLLTGKKRLRPFNKTNAGYKQTEVGIIPDDWNIKSLSEVGHIDSENLNSSTNPEYTFHYISLEDVDCGILRSMSEIQFKNSPSRARRKISKGDILFSTVRPNLKSHLLIKDTVKDWICSTGFSVLRCDNKIAHYGLIFYHFFENIINKQIDNLISGSNYPAISSKDFRLISIPLPTTLEEQTAIAQILSDMDSEIATLEKKRDKYKAIKQGMMQELLTGRIRLV